MNFLENIFTVPKGKIRFIELTCHDRKLLHQYLEHHYPDLKKFSIKCKKFGTEVFGTYIKCCGGSGNKIWMKYHYGDMANNRDERYTAYCNECGEYFSCECMFGDVGVKALRDCKMFAFGDYSFPTARYLIKGSAESSSKIQQILKGKDVHEVDAPPPLEPLCENKLGWYIYWSLQIGEFTQDSNNIQYVIPKSYLLQINKCEKARKRENDESEKIDKNRIKN